MVAEGRRSADEAQKARPTAASTLTSPSHRAEDRQSERAVARRAFASPAGGARRLRPSSPTSKVSTGSSSPCIR